ncbi:MAG TPA: GcrA family cell cycle regulator [Beijerinckiaceae bacterium]|nr:GcrA family cell cycle regulator [Beijerinckiaceae bacterium]
MSWTDERIERLKKLWSEGLSASQIAAELGGVTRNAVIGKVHRLHLSGRVKTSSTTAQRSRKTVRSQVRATPRVTTIARGNLAVVQLLDTEAVVAYRPAEEVVVPISRRISIMELREGTCRWPMGDPLQPDFVFCGGDCEVGKPYCMAHARVAFQPSQDRRRLAPR